ncbi:flavin reductase family protein [Nesterenkonia lutea]|nr:flavin reductase family protein [Nesterenkonia lutea]
MTSTQAPQTWEFGEFFGRYPAEVCIVTTQTLAGTPTGSTCTAVMALSDSPPSLLISFMTTSNTLKQIRRSGEFGVNAMGLGGESAVRRFATKAEDKFAGVLWHSPGGDTGYSGAMLSEGVFGYAHCRVENVIEVGDHALVVGHIDDILPGDVSTPLLYAQRAMWFPQAVPMEMAR